MSDKDRDQKDDRREENSEASTPQVAASAKVEIGESPPPPSRRMSRAQQQGEGRGEED